MYAHHVADVLEYLIRWCNIFLFLLYERVLYSVRAFSKHWKDTFINHPLPLSPNELGACTDRIQELVN